MKRFAPILVPGLAAVLVMGTASFALQKRVQPKGPREFPAVLQSASEAWKAGSYGRCLGELKDAMAIVTTKRAETIRAALPKDREGWKADPDPKNEAAANNPLVAAFAAGVGNVVERTYRQEGGRGRITATVTADSPLVQMFNMWLANPAMLGDGAELVEYEEHKAVLRKEGQGWNLQILINGKHVCEVRAQNASDEQIFAMFDQAVVNRLAEVLG